MTESSESRHNFDQRQLFRGIVRNLQEADLELLRPILETWIKDRDTKKPLPQEVDSVIALMQKSARGEGDTRYVVAVEEEKPIGVVGFRPLPETMAQYAQTAKPAELINAYVDSNFRQGQGVGRSLLQGLEDRVRQEGYEEILLNSGPRYKDTAWGFYNKMYGEPIAVMTNFYGEGGDAPVWRKSLKE